MGGGWSADLSYRYYERMLERLASDFHPILMRDAAERADRGEPYVIVRHDVDVSPRVALDMAGIEARHGIAATYMVLVNSPLYRIEEHATRDALKRMADMGHEVALHFDLEEEHRRNGCSSPEAVEPEIRIAADRLASALGSPVESVSFHRPIAAFIRGPLRVAGMINAYAADLMHWYLSDSDGRWREGEPLALLQQPRADLLQLLVHPIWWGHSSLSCGDRLAAFVSEECFGRPAAVRETLEETIFTAIGLRPTRNVGA